MLLNVASKYINISNTNHSGLFYIYYKIKPIIIIIKNIKNLENKNNNTNQSLLIQNIKEFMVKNITLVDYI